MVEVKVESSRCFSSSERMGSVSVREEEHVTGLSKAAATKKTTHERVSLLDGWTTATRTKGWWRA